MINKLTLLFVFVVVAFLDFDDGHRLRSKVDDLFIDWNCKKFR
jgi:hypothetical protein